MYLRGTGPEHHILAIHPGTQTTVRGYRLGLADRAATDGAAEELEARADTRIIAGPGPLDSPGGGYGLRIVDPDGREIELSAEVAQAGEPAAAPNGPPIRPPR